MNAGSQHRADALSPLSRTHQRFLILLLLAALTLAWPFRAQAQKQGTEKAAGTNSVVLMGHIARQQVRVEDSVRFWITVENPGDQQLENLRLDHMDTPGFDPPQRCWGS